MLLGRKNSKIFISETLEISMGSDNGNGREVYEDGTVNDGGTSAHDFLPERGRTDGSVPGKIKQLTSQFDDDVSPGGGCLRTLLIGAGIAVGTYYGVYHIFFN